MHLLPIYAIISLQCIRDFEGWECFESFSLTPTFGNQLGTHRYVTPTPTVYPRNQFVQEMTTYSRKNYLILGKNIFRWEFRSCQHNVQTPSPTLWDIWIKYQRRLTFSGLILGSMRPSSMSAISCRMLIMASQNLSSSALSSDSVGSTMSVPATGQDMVGAWNPAKWDRRTCLTYFDLPYNLP